MVLIYCIVICLKYFKFLFKKFGVKVKIKVKIIYDLYDWLNVVFLCNFFVFGVGYVYLFSFY